MKTKTYILVRPVYNNLTFPVGTIVKITDDYWGKDNSDNEENTGFTVVSGKLKGERGCVVDGLDGWLLENNKTNMLLIKNYVRKVENLKLREKLLQTMLNIGAVKKYNIK